MSLARMRRVFIVGLEEDKEKVLRILQETGVVHTEPSVRPSGEAEKQTTLIVQELRRIDQVHKSMKNYRNREGQATPPSLGSGLLLQCEKALESLQEVRSRRHSLEKIILDLSAWGDFNPDDLAELETEGVFVQRFRAEGISTKEFDIPEDVFVEVLSEKPNLRFLTVRLGRPLELPWATPLRRTEVGLRKAQEEVALLAEKESAIIRELSVLAGGIDELKKEFVALSNKANYTECLGSLYSEGILFGLQGWVPADTEEDLLSRLAGSGLALHITMREPLGDETPPTLLKNNWLIRQIEPLLKLYGLPSYRDLDPSYFFAPFMILFFGICLGDAGYGAIFLLGSAWLHKRFGHISPSMPGVMRLCETFSISAIIIGLITGSVFGYSFSSREWILIDIDKDHGDPMILFYVSLGLGLLHLTISYLMGVFESSSFHERFQKLGLLAVLWGGSCLVSQRIWISSPEALLHPLLYYCGLGLVACGLLFTLCFASDSRNLLVRFGLGLWNIYGLTGLVADLLSYARLFGLGIATTAIASVMNDLAVMVYRAAGPVAGSLFGFLVLITGHTFNLLLSILGSTVHSARLHFVEAFKSFFRGGGVEYRPFKVERG